MPQRAIAKQGGREPVAAAKRAREVRARIAHQPPHVADRDRPLLAQQLRRDRHPPRVQVLLKRIAELRIRALQLSRRGRQRLGDRRERKRATVVAGDDHPRQQIQPAAFAERISVHTPSTDPARAPGHRDALLLLAELQHREERLLGHLYAPDLLHPLLALLLFGQELFLARDVPAVAAPRSRPCETLSRSPARSCARRSPPESARRTAGGESACAASPSACAPSHTPSRDAPPSTAHPPGRPRAARRA